MKKSLIIVSIILVASFHNSYAQYDSNFAIGLKVGEPLALNLRKYFRSGERAFDLNIGTTGFLMFTKRNYRKEPLYTEAGLTVQGLFLYHRSGRNEKLHIYYGYGAHFNKRNLITTPVGLRDNNKKLFSFGPAVTAGVEYKLPDNDLGVFLETGGYLELAPSPLFFTPQINVGLRLNIVR